MEIHNNPYFQVLKNNDFYEIRFPANHTIIIPVLNLDSVVMIRAKRPILGKSIIEFPAGNIDTNESAEELISKFLQVVNHDINHPYVLKSEESRHAHMTSNIEKEKQHFQDLEMIQNFLNEYKLWIKLMKKYKLN